MAVGWPLQPCDDAENRIKQGKRAEHADNQNSVVAFFGGAIIDGRAACSVALAPSGATGDYDASLKRPAPNRSATPQAPAAPARHRHQRSKNTTLDAPERGKRARAPFLRGVHVGGRKSALAMKRGSVLLVMALLATQMLTGCSHSETPVAETPSPAVSATAARSTAVQWASVADFPRYPGALKISHFATTVRSGHTVMRSTSESFATNDPFEKVLSWYRSRMPAGFERHKQSNGQTAVFKIVGAEKRQFTVGILGGLGKTVISVSVVEPK